MSEKKNIDRLFQEKLKDFEVMPDEKVWYNIEAELKEKKKRRVIPIWWKLSGVAALFLFGVLGYNFIINSEKITIGNDNTIVLDENKETNTQKLIQPNSKTNTLPENEVVIEENNANNLRIIEEKQSIAFEKINSKKNANSNIEKEVDDKKTTFEKALTKLQKNKKDNTKELKTNNIDDLKPNSNSENNALVLEKSSKISNEIYTTKSMEKTPIEFDKKDSTAVAMKTVEPNALEKLLNEKEKQIESQESKINRWQISPTIAPVYFNSYSNGSPIAGEFENNAKTYENNLSYGLGVDYAINKKVTVRTGINSVRFGYNTNDIVYYADLEANGMKNINQSVEGSMIIVEDSPESNNLSLFNESAIGKTEGSLNQQFGYVEVPLELSYKIIDKKFGINVIGGMSTLFLTENKIAIVSEDVNTNFGKANNLNAVHFSTNVGVGFHYKFLKSFRFNFEPMFKYQINTFSEDAGNFKPYFIGLYSGVSYRF